MDWDFIRIAYNWIITSFEDIKEYFVVVLEFFEYLLDVIEGFFSSFFGDIKQILEKIDPIEKLNSIGNSMKDFDEDLRDFASGTFDTAKETAGSLIDDLGDTTGLWESKNYLIDYFSNKHH
jgi:hypothetical protein